MRYALILTPFKNSNPKSTYEVELTFWKNKKVETTRFLVSLEKISPLIECLSYLKAFPKRRKSTAPFWEEALQIGFPSRATYLNHRIFFWDSFGNPMNVEVKKI